MRLALFDLDNTLLGGDSDYAWGEYLISCGLVDADTHRRQNNAFYQQYKEGKLDIAAYVAFVAGSIAGLNPQRLRELHDGFMAEFIEPMLLPKAETLIARHKAEGDHCVIITATNRFITAPIATRLGIADLLATELEVLDGVYTGKMAGIPCYREGKVTRLEAYLAELNQQREENPLSLNNSIFYSDSFNDLPLLERAKEAIAVDPDDILLREAKERGWPVMSLR